MLNRRTKDSLCLSKLRGICMYTSSYIYLQPIASFPVGKVIEVQVLLISRASISIAIAWHQKGDLTAWWKNLGLIGVDMDKV